MTGPELIPGATYLVGKACGVPHCFWPLRFRLIRVQEHVGHASWLEGYELDEQGRAVDRRVVYVITAGLQLLRLPHAGVVTRRPGNAGPGRIPRPRISPEPMTPGRTR